VTERGCLKTGGSPLLEYNGKSKKYDSRFPKSG